MTKRIDGCKAPHCTCGAAAPAKSLEEALDDLLWEADIPGASSLCVGAMRSRIERFVSDLVAKEREAMLNDYDRSDGR